MERGGCSDEDETAGLGVIGVLAEGLETVDFRADVSCCTTLIVCLEGSVDCSAAETGIEADGCVDGAEVGSVGWADAWFITGSEGLTGCFAE